MNPEGPGTLIVYEVSSADRVTCITSLENLAMFEVSSKRQRQLQRKCLNLFLRVRLCARALNDLDKILSSAEFPRPLALTTTDYLCFLLRTVAYYFFCLLIRGCPSHASADLFSWAPSPPITALRHRQVRPHVFLDNSRHLLGELSGRVTRCLGQRGIEIWSAMTAAHGQAISVVVSGDPEVGPSIPLQPQTMYPAEYEDNNGFPYIFRQFPHSFLVCTHLQLSCIRVDNFIFYLHQEAEESLKAEFKKEVAGGILEGIVPSSPVTLLSVVGDNIRDRTDVCARFFGALKMVRVV